MLPCPLLCLRSTAAVHGGEKVVKQPNPTLNLKNYS